MPDVWLLALWTHDSDECLVRQITSLDSWICHLVLCASTSVFTCMSIMHVCMHVYLYASWLCLKWFLLSPIPRLHGHEFVILQRNSISSNSWPFPQSNVWFYCLRVQRFFSCNCYCIRWWNSWALSTKHIVPSDIIKPNLSHLVVIDRLMYMIYSSSSVQ